MGSVNWTWLKKESMISELEDTAVKLSKLKCKEKYEKKNSIQEL